MKKLLAPLFIGAFLFPPLLLAQPSEYLKVGVSYSSFLTEGGKSKPGLAVGLGKDFYPIRSFNGFFGLSSSYVIKKLKLENKTWPTNMQPEWSDVEVVDVSLDRSYSYTLGRLNFLTSAFRLSTDIASS